jgi:DNA-binding NarL/FixJ family response regulator
MPREERNVSHTGPVRLLLVDDNPAVLRQVAHVLPAGFEIVETLSSGEGLQAAIDARHPDVVVLDVTLPGENGLALAARIRESGSRVSVVFLTMHRDVDYVRSAMGTGACGYVVKMRLSLDLEPALRAAIEGERFVSPLPELNVDL